MSDVVYVPAGESLSDTATLLLAAAASDKNDFTAADVRTATHGLGTGFLVPADLATTAGVDYEDYEVPDPTAPASQQSADTEQARAEAAALTKDGSTGPDAEQAAKAPAKKTAKKTAAKKTARKAPAKKAAAKKTAAKKSTAKKA